MSIFLVDAFTDVRFSGNRAGVVLHGENYDSELRQKMAAELNASETVFATKLGENVYQAEYYTPTTEIDFCGHATIALFHTLARLGELELAGNVNPKVKTKAGEFPVKVTTSGDRILVSLIQTSAQYAVPQCSEGDVANALRLPEDAFDKNFPLALTKTGNWHLMVGLNSREFLDLIDYDPTLLTQILEQDRAVTAHVFCKEGSSKFHARNFGPNIDIPEDPATGSAAGAFGAYLVNQGLIPDGHNEVEIRQGGKKGRASDLTI